MSEQDNTETNSRPSTPASSVNRDSRDNKDGPDRKFSKRPRFRKKVLDTRNLKLDYKHPEVLERFISKTGKILPRRMTGATAKVQRDIAREIKRARQINLLPITRR